VSNIVVGALFSGIFRFSLIDIYYRFGGTSCLRFHGRIVRRLKGKWYRYTGREYEAVGVPVAVRLMMK
jgi:hypothetical protein